MSSAALTVTREEMIQDGHPNPEASERRKFASPEDRDTWRETIRQGLFAGRQRVLARMIASQHGEEI